MNILHIDTETTGIPISGQPSEDARHPHIVTLGAILEDADREIRSTYYTLIAPDGYRTEDFPESFKVHGITTEQASTYGVPLLNAMTTLFDIARSANIISAFDFHFDHKLLKIACARTGEFGTAFRAFLATKQSVCTMRAAADHFIGKRRMSLKNAYFECFKKPVPGAHNSLSDAQASRAIYHHLHENGIPLPMESMAEKVYDTPKPEVVQ